MLGVGGWLVDVKVETSDGWKGVKGPVDAMPRT